MMKHGFLVVAVFLLFGCYKRIEVSGFNREKWDLRLRDCTSGLDQAALILNSEEVLTNGEVQIKALLGEPDEHELYTRNEKFFYYQLTADSCSEQKSLSIRFNAIDRAKELAVIVK